MSQLQDCTLLVGTYNLQQLPLPLDVTAWLSGQAPAGKQGPDLVAIGFQECAPYPDAFLTPAHAQLDEFDRVIQRALQQLYPQCSYRRVACATMVGVALLVYIRMTATFQLTVTVGSEVGCGPAFAGNKGAVGVRCQLRWPSSPHSDVSSDGSEDATVMTTELVLVCAHLSAHTRYLQRRHAELRAICQRLVFAATVSDSPTTPLQAPLLFLLGDLNYRVTRRGDEADREDEPAWARVMSDRFAAAQRDTIDQLYRSGDQLSVARTRSIHSAAADASAAASTESLLQLFQEAPIHFPPTYKFQRGTDQYEVAARAPAWCDRILYYCGRSEDAVVPVEPVWYNACFEYRQSDHRPVAGLFRIGVAGWLQASQLPWRVRTSLPLTRPILDPGWQWKWMLGRGSTVSLGWLWYLAVSGWFWRSLLTLTVIGALLFYRSYTSTHHNN